MLWQSSTVLLSPIPLRTLWSSRAEMEPLLSRSKRRKASLRSWRVPPLLMPWVFSSTNSCKSMKPSPSESTAFNIRRSSSGGALYPNEFMMAPSSSHEIFPSPLASNLLNTPSNSSAELLSRTEFAEDDDDGCELLRCSDGVLASSFRMELLLLR
eukprot:Gb_03902 [translate_table: standard]